MTPPILPIFADSYKPDWLALAIAGLAIACAIWQFRIQLDKVRRPSIYFQGESQRNLKFLRRQAKRRVQLACLAGIFGALMLVGLFLPYERYPQLWGIVWILALLFLGWAGCLALVDFVSLKLHFGIELDRQRAEKLALDYKMKKFHEQSLQELEQARREDAADEADADSQNSSD